MIDVKIFVFKEFVCTEEQAENFVRTITFPVFMLEFRRILQQSSEQEIDAMVKLMAETSPSIPEQTAKDLFKQTCQGTDAVYEETLAVQSEDNEFSIATFLQYLTSAKQEQLVSTICAKTMTFRGQAKHIEPRGSKKPRPMPII